MERRASVEMVGWASLLLAILAWFIILIAGFNPAYSGGNDDTVVVTMSFLLFSVSSLAGLLSFQKWQGSVGLQISLVSIAIVIVAKLFLLQ